MDAEPVKRRDYDTSPIERGVLVMSILHEDAPRYTPIQVLADKCGVSYNYMRFKFLPYRVEIKAGLDWSQDGKAVRLTPKGEDKEQRPGH